MRTERNFNQPHSDSSTPSEQTGDTFTSRLTSESHVRASRTSYGEYLEQDNPDRPWQNSPNAS